MQKLLVLAVFVDVAFLPVAAERPAGQRGCQKVASSVVKRMKRGWAGAGSK